MAEAPCVSTVLELDWVVLALVNALPVSPNPRSESVVAVFVPQASRLNCVPLEDLISRLFVPWLICAVRPACRSVELLLNDCFRLSTALCRLRATPVVAKSTYEPRLSDAARPL